MNDFSQSFLALLKEAAFTKEILGSGATQIRSANYARKGVYFLAFTSLATGFERIGKLCLLLDFYIESKGTFPDSSELKNRYGHRLMRLYDESQAIISRRSLSLDHDKSLDDPVQIAVLQVLSDFAIGDRYSNINLLIGRSGSSDPIAAWHTEVDKPIYTNRVATKTKAKILRNAGVVNSVLGELSSALHIDEAGRSVTELRDASELTGISDAVAPIRQLIVLQIIRYWVEVLLELGNLASAVKGEHIPYFSEILEDSATTTHSCARESDGTISSSTDYCSPILRTRPNLHRIGSQASRPPIDDRKSKAWKLKQLPGDLYRRLTICLLLSSKRIV